MATTIRFRLTVGQKLQILRRRYGESQAQAAKRLRVPLKRYRYWEENKYTHDSPTLKAINLLPHEQCWLLRREARLTQLQVAEAMGLSRYWVQLMETGVESPVLLVRWWDARPSGK
jgi:transcriptional regulator with XRE-family HTH domain